MSVRDEVLHLAQQIQARAAAGAGGIADELAEALRVRADEMGEAMGDRQTPWSEWTSGERGSDYLDEWAEHDQAEISATRAELKAEGLAELEEEVAAVSASWSGGQELDPIDQWEHHAETDYNAPASSNWMAEQEPRDWQENTSWGDNYEPPLGARIEEKTDGPVTAVDGTQTWLGYNFYSYDEPMYPTPAESTAQDKTDYVAYVEARDADQGIGCAIDPAVGDWAAPDGWEVPQSGSSDSDASAADLGGSDNYHSEPTFYASEADGS